MKKSKNQVNKKPRVKKPSKHLFNRRDIEGVLATVPDNEANRDLVAKYARIQAILVSNSGANIDRLKAKALERALWAMLVDESQRGAAEVIA